MRLRPSALPALSACPCFIGDGGNADTERGTKRHELFSALLSHPEQEPTIPDGLDEADIDGVKWAADYVRMHAPMSDYPLRLEYHVNPLTETFDPLFERGGRLDAACGNHLFDLKWRRYDYRAQMCAYALDLFDEFGFATVHVHLLFAESQRAEHFEITETEARQEVDKIICSVLDPNSKPRACDYCGWCANSVTCPVNADRVNAIAAGREDWALEQYHASKIEDPVEMGKALRLARQIADWCESVEHHALNMALKQGKVPGGFALKTRQGNRFISDLSGAFGAAGLPQPDFLKACECKLSRLTETYAAFHVLKKATAEREVCRKLGDLVQRKPSTQYLTTEK
jgi:hypothetical protein